MDIEKIQAFLVEHELDGWLMADFHGRNPIAIEMLQIVGMITRRSFYFIPVEGEPVALVHNIEKMKYTHLAGKQILFSSYRTMEAELQKILHKCKRVAMEYAPMGRLPYIGLVDAGTIELVKSFGVEVVSSANLVANFQARLTPEQIATHRIAAHNLLEIKEASFALIKEALSSNRTITEHDVCVFILDKFDKYDMTTESGPNCSVDANAGNPHYEPTAEKSATIKKGQLILLDLWGKIKHKDGVNADITWMAFSGSKAEIPDKFVKPFAVLCNARDAAVEYIRQHIDNQPVYGSQVDDACRAVVEQAGYGAQFVHRTGHSITGDIHGTGPNIDNLETEDKRRLQKGHLFSVEPGVYFDDGGLRTEIDVLIGHNGAEVTTLPVQTEIRPLF